MNKYIAALICFLAFTTTSKGQSIIDLVNKVDLDSLTLTLNEFTGEQSTVVNGSTVTILNREEDNNDLAADYLVQKLSQYDNLTITDQAFNANGRNIIATQLGQTNPNDIYIVCAHYDSVADYCADDNASGTATVLEIARILSTQCIDNTIVYALWDEEEIGLRGAGYYASQAASNGDNILGVLNIDMMGYDGDDDDGFDIDVRPIANSIAMKDDIVSVLGTYGFNLNVNVVNPGTTASDHARFWNNGFSAVLVGESWENNDETPFYHSSGDTFATLDLPYYHELAKLIMAYMTTKAGLIGVDNTVTFNSTTLTAAQSSANYQWIDCDTNTEITGETNQSFTPSADGNYAVEVTSGACVEMSDCVVFDFLSVDEFSKRNIKVYPNPVVSNLFIEQPISKDMQLQLLSVDGKILLKKTISRKQNSLDMSQFSNGIYFVKLESEGSELTYKIVKE